MNRCSFLRNRNQIDKNLDDRRRLSSQQSTLDQAATETGWFPTIEEKQVEGNDRRRRPEEESTGEDNSTGGGYGIEMILGGDCDWRRRIRREKKTGSWLREKKAANFFRVP